MYEYLYIANHIFFCNFLFHFFDSNFAKLNLPWALEICPDSETSLHCLQKFKRLLLFT